MKSGNLHSALPNAKQLINLRLDLLNALGMLCLNRPPLVFPTLLALQTNRLDKCGLQTKKRSSNLFNNAFGGLQYVDRVFLGRDWLRLFLGLAFDCRLAFT